MNLKFAKLALLLLEDGLETAKLGVGGSQWGPLNSTRAVTTWT